MESKRYINTGRNSELKRICTPYLPITTNNRYDALLNLIDHTSNEDDVTSATHGLIPAKKLKTPHVTEIAQSKRYHSGVQKKVNIQHRCDKTTTVKRARKKTILIVGDSNVKGMARGIQHNLEKDYAVQGIVKSGADMEVILLSSNANEIRNLTKNGFLIIWGGVKKYVEMKHKNVLNKLVNLSKVI
jgi:hypothetical protein